jgi:hypothetical protein
MLALVPVLLVPLGWWRIDSVEIDACPALPDPVRAELVALSGASPLTLDLRRVQHLVEAWPGVAGVSVAVELPSTLRVQARGARVAGSMPVGTAWHAVAETGEPAARIDAPVRPVLRGFATVPAELRVGLEVAARLEQGSGLEVLEVRQVMPDDLEVVLEPAAEPPVAARVGAETTATERAWCAAVLAGARPATWTDLRQPNRVIVRRGP